MPIASPGIGFQPLRDAGVSQQTSGGATTPSANAALASVTITAAGNYEVTAYAWLVSGTPGSTDTNNVQLRQNGLAKGNLPQVGAVNQPILPPFVALLNCASGDTVSLNAVATSNGTTVVYATTLMVRQVG